MKSRRLHRLMAPVRSHPRIAGTAAVALAVVLAAVAWHAIYHPLRNEPNARRYADYVRAGSANLTVDYFAVELPIDGSDYRQLAGFADTIVAGTVTDVAEAPDMYGTPASRVTIDVKAVLKGRIPQGRTQLLAEGGTTHRDGKTVLTIPDQGRPITAGLSYMLASRYSPEQHADVLIPRAGQIELSGLETDDMLATGGAGSGQLSTMRDAVAHQVPFQ